MLSAPRNSGYNIMDFCLLSYQTKLKELSRDGFVEITFPSGVKGIMAKFPFLKSQLSAKKLKNETWPTERRN